MASPQLRPKTRVLVPRDWSSESAALRLLSAEHSALLFGRVKILSCLPCKTCSPAIWMLSTVSATPGTPTQ